MYSNRLVLSKRLCFFLSAIGFVVFTSCSIEKQLSRSAKENVLNNNALKNAHVGITIFDPSSGKYLFNYQGDKYFIPASNTKLPTCYAAMKYLGDSLVGLYYQKQSDSLYYIAPTGDPTFLFFEYPRQPVYDFFRNTYKGTTYIFQWENLWKEQGLGTGWSWDDYMETYMAERSPFPIYGNLIKFWRVKDSSEFYQANGIRSIPGLGDPFYTNKPYVDSNKFKIERELGANRFFAYESNRKFDTAILTIADPANFFQTKFVLAEAISKDDQHLIANRMRADVSISKSREWKSIKTQPLDSLLKPMMHRSDNFFAEQALLMVSNIKLGVMSDSRIIDTLLKTDLKGMPQPVRWVDGSGLSRFNLFSPQDFVFILNKMKNEFGMERIKVILPTGGEGTITSYYKADSSFIYAKTGTLTGVVALSGFLTTKRNKQLIFSVLVNNHQGSAVNVRRAVEKFIQRIRNDY